MRAVLALSLWIGCAGDGASGPPMDAGGDAPLASDGAPAPDGGAAAAIGEIRLAERAGAYGDNGHVYAEFVAGGRPSFHEETMREGDCRLLEYVIHFCDPPCAGWCIDENDCVEWPTFVGAGTLSFSGLKTALDLTPQGCGFCQGEVYYPPGPLPADLFDPGDPVGVEASGGAIASFSAIATGPEAMVTSIGDMLVLADGGDAVVSWTPAGGDARVRLLLNANNLGHGAPYQAILDCDVADTGSLTIPRALVEAFPHETINPTWPCAGSDCPPSILRRYRRDAASVSGGQVELIVASEVLFGFQHDP